MFSSGTNQICTTSAHSLHAQYLAAGSVSFLALKESVADTQEANGFHLIRFPNDNAALGMEGGGLSYNVHSDRLC